MECRTARMLADLRGPHAINLAPDDEAALQQHLQQCAACSTLLTAPLHFDDRLASAMTDIPVPAGLKERIRSGLVHERAGWYRRRALQTAAIAATLFLTIGIAVNWQHERKPSLELADSTLREIDDGLTNRRGAADQWLAREKIGFHPPLRFDFRLLMSHGLQEMVPGRMVPCLHFVNAAKNVEARVFIVRAEQFNTEMLQETTYSCQNSGYQVQVLKDMHHDKQFYVVIYNGDNLIRDFTRSNESV